MNYDSNTEEKKSLSHVMYRALSIVSEVECRSLELSSVDGAEAGIFLQAMPIHSNLLGNPAFVMALCVRLGLRVVRVDPQVKYCGCSQKTALDAEGIHWSKCVQGNHFIDRHDRVTALFQREGQRAGLDVSRINPVVGGEESKKAVDAIFKGDIAPFVKMFAAGNGNGASSEDAGVECLLTDVTVVTGNLLVAEKAKKRKYEGEAKKLQGLVIPLVFSWNGKWGAEAVQFVKTLASAYCDHRFSMLEEELDLGQQVWYFKCRVAVELQRQNALLLMKRKQVYIDRVNKMRGDGYEAAKDAVMPVVCVDCPADYDFP